MGERGFFSRILCPKFGGFLSFGTIDSGIVSAPGQPTMKDLCHLYNFRQIGPDTKVFGIIGKPVGHSKSPILYNEAFKSVGFNGVYVPFLVDDIAKFLQTYSSSDFAGFRFNLLYWVLSKSNYSIYYIMMCSWPVFFKITVSGVFFFFFTFYWWPRFLGVLGCLFE